MVFRSALINVMTAAARKAARVLVHDFGEVEQLQVSKKGPADFVSAADRRAEQIGDRAAIRCDVSVTLSPLPADHLEV